MGRMRYLVDMNISPRTVEILADAGYDAFRLPAVLPANVSDKEILDWAGDNGYVIITQDMDFSALIALQGGSKPSLLNVRMAEGDPELIGQRLLRVLPIIEEDLESGACVTLDDSAIRVRSLPLIR